MVTSVSNSSNPALPVTQTPASKPWAPGDPSSFQQLFSGTGASAPASVAPAGPPAFAITPPVTPTIPSPQFTFEQGATVTGLNTSTPMNPEEMASASTAAKIATMLGGTVDSDSDTMGGAFSASAPTREISFADSKAKINAGIAAYLFNTYGTAQGSAAWQSINQTLGRDLMST